MADQQPDYDLQEIPHDPFAGVDPIVSPAPAAIPRITVHPQSRVQDNLPPGSDLSVGAPVAKQGQTVQPVDIPQGFEAMRSGVAGTLGAVTGLTTPISEMSDDEQKLFALTAGIGMIAPGEGRAAGIAEEAIPAVSRIAREAHPGWIDQRMPNQLLPGASSRKGYDIEATFGGNEEPRIVDAETMARNPNLFKKNTDLVKDYPNVRPFAGAPPNQVARSFIGQMADNLVWLYNQIPQEVRDRSKQWYVGGNKVINDWAKQYDLPDTTVAGVTAALSPLSGWYRNVANAQRMLEILKNNTFEWSPEMDTTLRNIPMFEKARYAGAADTARGKSLQDIDQLPLSPEAKAAAKASWVRIYDEAHNPRDYQLWSPEGEQLGPVMSKNTNKPERMAWTFPEAMAKAIQIYDSGGDRNAINAIMGDQHKIRNFYNNLLDPWSPYRDVTIDTHAVAAAHLRPFGGSDLEVAHNFGNTPVKNEYGESQQGSFGSDITGIRGLYPLYADAYRNAAQRLGIMPRELQSITWEGIRGLFPEDWKSVKNSAIIDNIWRQYKSGKVGIDETRQRVFDHAAAERPDWAYPDWWDKQPVSGAHEGNRSAVNTPELSGIGARPEARGEGPGGGRGYGAGAVPPEDDLNPPSVLKAWRQSGATGIPFVDRSGAAPRNLSYELDFGAGAPYNAKFPGWSGLSGDQKTQISGEVLPKIVNFAKKVTGAEEAARVTGLGGWHEFTNPAFKSQLNTSPEVAKDVADIIGYLAQQTKMFGYRPSASGDRVGVALYGEDLGDAAKVRALWSRLAQEHPDFAAGFSPSVNAEGQPGIEMIFDQGGPEMAGRVKKEFVPALQKVIDEQGLGDIRIKDFNAAEESREHDWEKDPTGSSYLRRLRERYGPDIQQRLDAFAHQEVDPDIRAGIRRAFGSGGLEKAQREAADAAAGRPKLVGLPDKEVDLNGKPYVPGPIGYIHDLAEKYMKDAALPYEPPNTFAPVDKERAIKIAQAFDNMKHAPDDPKVQASYNALIDETLAQYRAIKKAGIKFDFIKPGMRDPYAENPRLAAQDVLLNKHLWVFPTEGGFGSGTASAEEAMKNNPLLRPTDEYINGHRLLANDVFRIVHDVFGHLKDGNGFRANGEENAWRSHSAMYSDLARPAMTSETRGQNSWVNFGPHGEANRKASAADTTYADQKIGLLPKWAIEEGRKDTKRASGGRIGYQEGGDVDDVGVSEFPAPHGVPQITVHPQTKSDSNQPPYDLTPVDFDPFVPQPQYSSVGAMASALGTMAKDVGEGVVNAAAVPGAVAQRQFDVAPSGPPDAQGRPTWTEEDQQRLSMANETIANRATDLAGIAMTGGIPMAEEGALGMVGGKLSTAAAEQPAPRFYSAVENAVTNAKTNAAPANQWLGMLRNSPGVKPEELSWLGVEDFLKDRPGSVSKQDLADYIRGNKVDVQEVGHGEAPELTLAQAKERAAQGLPFHAVERANPEVVASITNDRGQLLPYAERNADNFIFRPGTFEDAVSGRIGPKFSQYTLPGAEPGSYREMLLTLPTPNVRYMAFTDAMRAKYGDKPLGLMPMTPDERAFIDKQINAYGDTGGTYKSPHWEEPNVLAHVRFDDRTINGEKDLHVAEIQSDWHQAGRKQGYGIEGVPDAPFKTTWPELALKRMIRYASENGYERLSWDTGATNADRYDLSKYIDRLHWSQTPGTDPIIGELRGYKDGQRVLTHPMVTAEHLPDYVGKDVAEKLVNAPLQKNAVTGEKIRALSGLDLKVGGEGMKGFYDRILPNVANKLVKKYGAKVEGSEVVGEPRFDLEFPGGGSSGSFSSAEEARKYRDGHSDTWDILKSAKIIDNTIKNPVHSIKITPELRKAAMTQGFPLFATGGRVPKDMEPETAKQRIEGEFKDLYRQQTNNPSLDFPYFEPSERGMPIGPDEISTPPWGSGGLRTERQEGGTIPEEQTSDQWRPAGGGEAVVAPALEAAQAISTYAPRASAYYQHQIQRMWEDSLNPFSSKSNKIDPRSQFADGGSASPDYDYDAAQVAGIQPDARGHLPDTYKLPNHITFSDESIYHGKDGDEGGHWSPISGSSDDPENQRWLFTPGKTNLENYTPQELQDYFQTFEPNSVLNIQQGFPGYAHGGRVDARNVERHPTPAQIAANNYAHDRIHALGLRISIENAKNSYREGVGKDGKKWRAKMPKDSHYGYILGTTARDLDHLDCFVGPHRLSPKIFVIDQINPDTGAYDEAKCMLFFADANHARRAYEASFSDGKGKNRLGKITEMTIPAFKTWLDQGNITKPFKHPLSRKERVEDIVRRHA